MADLKEAEWNSLLGNVGHIEHTDMTDDLHDTKRDLEPMELITMQQCFNTIFSFIVGSAFIISPYLVRELGVLPYTLCFTLITLLQYYASCLLGLTTWRFLNENMIVKTTRYAYQRIAEASGGKTLRFISVFAEYLFLTCYSITGLLFASSTVIDFFPKGFLTRGNATRLSSAIFAAILIPLSNLGTFSDIQIPVTICLVTAIASMFGILINCTLLCYFYGGLDLTNIGIKEEHQSIFMSLGAIFFKTSSSVIVPNLCILSKSPGRILRPVTLSYVMAYIVILFSALLPYYTFDGNVSASTLRTFNHVLSKYQNLIAFKIITYCIRILMAIHYTLAVQLYSNALFLHLENTLHIPYKWNWKRPFLRMCFILGILLICLALPRFRFAVSLAGGVPGALICVLLPLFMYTKVFELDTCKRNGVYFLIAVASVINLGALLESVRSLLFHM